MCNDSGNVIVKGLFLKFVLSHSQFRQKKRTYLIKVLTFKLVLIVSYTTFVRRQYETLFSGCQGK